MLSLLKLKNISPSSKLPKLILFGFKSWRKFLLLLPQRPLLMSFRGLGYLIALSRAREVEICRAQAAIAANYLNSRTEHKEESTAKSRLSQEDYREKLPRLVFAHVLQALGEALTLPYYLQTNDNLGPRTLRCELPLVSSSGQEVVHEIIRSGLGAVAISGHIGCFELLAAFHVQCGVRLSVIGRAPNIPFLVPLLEELRREYGVETIWRNNAASSRKLLQALREGQVIAALIDQDTHLENEFAPFFGLDAAHPIMPIRLAIRNGLPILSSFIVRVAPLRHHIITRRIDYDPRAKDCEQLVLNTFAQHLQQLVCQHPEQWIWWHRRWRRRPGIDYEKYPELLLNSREYIKWLREEVISD